MTKQPAKRPRGRPPVGETEKLGDERRKALAVERHNRYMARLRARAGGVIGCDEAIAWWRRASAEERHRFVEETDIDGWLIESG